MLAATASASAVNPCVRLGEAIEIAEIYCLNACGCVAQWVEARFDFAQRFKREQSALHAVEDLDPHAERII